VPLPVVNPDDLVDSQGLGPGNDEFAVVLDNEIPRTFSVLAALMNTALEPSVQVVAARGAREQEQFDGRKPVKSSCLFEQSPDIEFHL
jgi:hypothetical protein